MAVLRMTVYVADERGNVHRFLPGEEVPGWAAAKIRNPRVWAGGDSSAPPAAAPAAPDQEVTPAAAAGDKPPAVGPPPQGGPGSGRTNWVAYAQEHKVDVDPEWSRDDIIDELDARGIQV